MVLSTSQQQLANQIDLFEHVAGAYAQPISGRLTNKELYRIAVGRAGIEASNLNRKTPVGQAGKERSILKRQIRWRQQTLRQLGIIERVEGMRGVWELTQAGKSKLLKIRDGISVLGFRTDLGMAIWSNCTSVFSKWDEPIFLVLTSPPYPLSQPRAYGNPPIEEYLDFICQSIEPLVRNLVKGGNVVLSLGDVFEQGSPAKSTYIEELTIALRKRLGLYLMNRIVWESNKPPGPIQWASKQRMQLNEGYEFCLWFCNDPNACIADNRRVLEPHTEAHKKLIERGGEQRVAIHGDGAYHIRHGSYGQPTVGRIPRNVFHVSNHCASQRAYKKRAKEMGLVPHGATMPLKLARKLVRFLTDVEQTVADPFGGSMTTPFACELENRSWIATENVFDYVRGGAERFVDRPGYELRLNIELTD
ncbi:DNA methyltransferase [Iodobacter sp. CM08]|uniref:DNA methyltransferase n=1 Tax=Iodobacter sp. CM08 TaxID=3085902 RepID=UPI002980F433|nr:DNA methyltransferase [Iodobacter sp. CM08]MDW5419132.1 DNA methyltransferase [Iodobacter sp. CM08]